MAIQKHGYYHKDQSYHNTRYQNKKEARKQLAIRKARRHSNR